MRRRIYVCCLLLLVSSTSLALAAQQPSSSSGDQFNASDPFAGMDPLAGRGAGTPLPTSGPCVPPRYSNWKLVGQDNINCYWSAPYPQRINGYISNINNVGALQKFFVKCGSDPFDHTKVICQNPGDDQPGAPRTTGPPGGIGITNGVGIDGHRRCRAATCSRPGGNSVGSACGEDRKSQCRSAV